MTTVQSRRQFLKLSALASALVASSPAHALSIHDKWYLKRGEKQRILILGAGMAGMAAAIELIKLGHDVIVVEGQSRAGGRIQTIRAPFADDLYADVGAARIPESHEWTMKYIKQYDLKLQPFHSVEGEYVDVIRGKKIRYSRNHPAELKEYPVELTNKEKSLGNELPDAIMKPLLDHIGDARSMDWPPAEIAKYDQYTYLEYLEHAGYSKACSEVLNLGWELDDAVLQILREEVLANAGPRNKIIGGNDRLPTKMAEELSGTIRYGIKVLNIEQSANDVSVMVAQGNEHRTMKADRVICTIPLPVLRRMEFVKTLSREKRMAIYELSYQILSRTVMQVSERYWKKEGLNGFARTDQPMEIWDPNYESTQKRGLIAAYIKNVDSRIMLDWPDQKRLDFSAGHIDKVFPGLFTHLEGGYTKCWGEDPWALGATAFATKGQIALSRYLSQPEGRIHFAGEHASAYQGWIQGAIESGNRAAKEVNSF